jgi:L-threonylcarbamoyladenylate synthase
LSAAAALCAGGLVIHPTETVYGLGGDGSARSNALVARLKGRAAERGLILLVSSVESARAHLPRLRWNEAAETLAERFWPGPLSIVVPCPDAPAGLAGPGGGVALRATSDPVARAILAEWGAPMTSTSANRTGEPPPRTAAEAARLVEGRTEEDVVVCVVDAGPRTEAAPSTIVSLTGATPRVWREGPIPADEVVRALERTGRS